MTTAVSEAPVTDVVRPAPLRVGVLAAVDSRAPGAAWSAVAYYMSRALERHLGDVVHLSPRCGEEPLLPRAVNSVAALIGVTYDCHNSMLEARRWSRRIKQGLKTVDMLVVCGQAALIALLDADVPVVYSSDATFDLVRDYYPFYTRLPRWNARVSERLEQLALQRADLISYPSVWAARSALEHYRVPETKIHVAPYGANMEEVPPFLEATSVRYERDCRLLFVGNDWQRKGGDIAVATTASLRGQGIQATLTVVGCSPEKAVPEYVRVVPRLHKSDPYDRARLSALYLQSHFLVLPTRADCTPHVICEASAHGTPALVTDTGGVGGALRQGTNGFLFARDATAGEFARTIAALLSEPSRYADLRETTRLAYDHELNWDAWAISLARRARQVARGA